MCCCNDKTECCHPEDKRDPQACTPEQIRQCHGDAPEHPCAVKTAEQE